MSFEKIIKLYYINFDISFITNLGTAAIGTKINMPTLSRNIPLIYILIWSLIKMNYVKSNIKIHNLSITYKYIIIFILNCYLLHCK